MKNQIITNCIYNENCLETMKQMPDNFVNLVFTDPPYNVGKDYGVYKDDLSEKDYLELMKNIIEECKRISNNRLAFFVGSKRTQMFWNLISDARCIIVKKGAISTPNRSLYYRQWSSLLVNVPPNERIYDIWEDIRMPGEGYFFREERFEHPGLTAQRLVARVLRYFTKENDVVYDPFNGVGTTSVTCLSSKRKFIGSELNRDYCIIARQRIEKNNNNLQFWGEKGKNEIRLC